VSSDLCGCFRRGYGWHRRSSACPLLTRTMRGQSMVAQEITKAFAPVGRMLNEGRPAPDVSANNRGGRS
jgi:hypothetical protein